MQQNMIRRPTPPPPTEVTREMVLEAAAQCRHELARLAGVIQHDFTSKYGALPAQHQHQPKSPQTASSSNATSPVAMLHHSSAPSFSSHSSSASASPPASSSAGKKSESSLIDLFSSVANAKDKFADIHREYLALAEACKSAARVSDAEVSCMRQDIDNLKDNVKLLQVLKRAVEDERDKLEDKNEALQKLVDTLRDTRLEQTKKSSSSSSLLVSSVGVSTGPLQEHGLRRTGGDDGDDDSPSRASQDQHHTTSPLHSECRQCVALRSEHQRSADSWRRKEQVMQKEIDSLRAERNNSVKEAVSAAQAKAAAQQRYRAAAFMIHQATSDALQSKNLATAELVSLSLRTQVNDLCRELEEKRWKECVAKNDG